MYCHLFFYLEFKRKLPIICGNQIKSNRFDFGSSGSHTVANLIIFEQIHFDYF